MRINSKNLKMLILRELYLLSEGCGESEEMGSECPTCSAGLKCPCDDDHDHDDFRNLNRTNISPDEAFSAGEITDDDDEKLLSKVEALRIVTAIAQNTSCPVTRSALLDVVEDLGVEDGDEWSLDDDDDQVDVDWSNPQYGNFKGDIGDMESKDDAFGVGFSMGQSGDFDKSDYVVSGRKRKPG